MSNEIVIPVLLLFAATITNQFLSRKKPVRCFIKNQLNVIICKIQKTSKTIFL